MRIFITGDCHGVFDHIESFCCKMTTTKNDILIILGDAGILFYGEKSYRENYIKETLAQLPITLFCVRGNHEDRPANRAQINLVYNNMVNGDVYMDERYPSILFAKDGEIYTINGQTYGVVGGAYSIDKFYRLAMGRIWFADEQLTEEERVEIGEKWAGKHIQHILAHTCPYTWEPTDLFLKGVDQSLVDASMEHWLEQLVCICTWDHYWFGHFHDDRIDVCDDGKVSMLFNEIVEIYECPMSYLGVD